MQYETQPTWAERAGMAWRTAWPVLTLALLMLAVALWQDARFPSKPFNDPPPATPAQLNAIRAGLVPSSFGWVDWTIFTVIPFFLLTKTNVMVRRLTYLDWLALSLVASNTAFAGLYSLAMAGDLYPLWFATHRETVLLIQNMLRLLLSLAVVASILLLVLVPEPDRVRWPWVHRYVAPALVAGSALLVLFAWSPGWPGWPAMLWGGLGFLAWPAAKLYGWTR